MSNSHPNWLKIRIILDETTVAKCYQSTWDVIMLQSWVLHPTPLKETATKFTFWTYNLITNRKRKLRKPLTQFGQHGALSQNLKFPSGTPPDFFLQDMFWKLHSLFLSQPNQQSQAHLITCSNYVSFRSIRMNVFQFTGSIHNWIPQNWWQNWSIQKLSHTPTHELRQTNHWLFARI